MKIISSQPRVQRVQRVQKVQRVVVAASPQFLRGRGSAAGCVEGLHRFAQGATAALPLRVMVAPFGRRF